MDINVLRSAVTLAAFLVFVGIFLWAYRPSRQKQFEEAANLPFRDGE